MTDPTLIDRLWAKIEIPLSASSCWNWTASLNGGGYGQIGQTDPDRPGQRMAMAHRAMYELLVGPIPPGQQIDHLCRNRTCVNPLHLEVVTNRENAHRGVSNAGGNFRKTHCVRGHPLAGDNLRITPDGRRKCRRCHADHNNGYEKAAIRAAVRLCECGVRLELRRRFCDECRAAHLKDNQRRHRLNAIVRGDRCHPSDR